MPRRGLAWAGRIAALVTGAAALAVLAGVALLPELVEGQVADALEQAGFAEAEFVLDRVGLDGAEGALRLPGDQGIERVRVTYDVDGLLAGRVGRVVLEGARLHLTAGGDGVGIEGFAPPAREGAAEASAPSLPVEDILIERGVLTVSLPAGTTEIPVEGRVGPADGGGIGFDLTAGLSVADAGGRAEIEGVYGPEGLRLAFVVAPSQSGPGTIAGSGQITWVSGALPTGQANLEVKDASLPNGAPITVDVAWSGTDGSHELSAVLRPAPGVVVQAGAKGGPGPDGMIRGSGIVDVTAENLKELAGFVGMDLPVAGRGMLSLRMEEATPSDLGPVTAALRLDGFSYADLLRDATVQLAGVVEQGEGGAWTLTAATDQTVEGLAGSRLAAMLPAELAPGALYLALRPGPESPLRVQASEGSASLSGAVGLELGGVVLGGLVPGAQAHWDENGLESVAFSLENAVLDAAPWQVSAQGVGAKLAYAPAGPDALNLAVSAGNVNYGAPRPLVTPFTLQASAAGNPAGRLSFTAEAGAAAGAVVVDVAGSHEVTTGRGQADVVLHPLRIGPGGRELSQLLPGLADQMEVEEARGTVGLRGRIGWGEGAVPGAAELLLEDVAVTASALAVQGLSGVVVADSLSPLVMPEQELAVALIDVGLPLTDGLLRYAVDADGTLRMEQATFDWAGGQVRAEPFRADIQDRTGRVELVAEGLDLGQVLSLAGVEGLAAKGTLNGRIPVVVGEDAVRFVDGRLEAAEPGRIQYDPDDPPSFLDPGSNDSTALVMQVLQNFRYEELSVTIDGAAGGEMDVKLKVKGSNPDFYGGYPVSLNLNLSGALGSILRSGIGSYRLPDTVRARIEQFRKSNP